MSAVKRVRCEGEGEEDEGDEGGFAMLSNKGEVGRSWRGKMTAGLGKRHFAAERCPSGA